MMKNANDAVKELKDEEKNEWEEGSGYMIVPLNAIQLFLKLIGEKYEKAQAKIFMKSER